MPTMKDDRLNLGDVPTRWSRVLKAGETKGDTAAEARNALLVHYHEAVLRYLRAELRDDNAAGVLYSNFAVRVLEADPFLKRADPERGRFRDYLKAVLRRMVIDYYREQQRENRKREYLVEGSEREPAEESAGPPEDERRFLDCWRQELIAKTWGALEEAEKRTGKPHATLLRLQEEQPGLRSAQLAEVLAARLGRPFTAAGVRQLVHRGRELFGDLLVTEVARSLQIGLSTPADVDRVEAELIDLGLLLSYSKAALARYRGLQ
jgi:RNA polymerase sigma factor (sigma-70 family)